MEVVIISLFWLTLLLLFKLFLLPYLSLQLLDLLDLFFPVFLQLFLDSDSPRIRAEVVVRLVLRHTLMLKNLLVQIDLQRHL